MPQGKFTWTPDDTDVPVPEEKTGLWERIGGLRGVAAAGTRGLSGLLSTPGGYWGAGISGLGEGIAQAIEESDIAAPFKGEGTQRIATEAALGAIPFSKILRAGRPVLSAALRGGLYSGGGEAMRELARDEGVIDPLSVAGHAAFGGGTAGALAKFMKAKPVKTAEPYIVEPTAQPGGQVLSGAKKGPKVVPSVSPKPIPRGPDVPRPVDLGLEPKAPVAYGGAPAEASGRVAKILSKEAKVKQALDDSFMTALAKKGQRLSEAETKEILRDQRMLEKALRGGGDDAEDVLETASRTAPAAPRSPDLPITQPTAPPEANPFVAAAVRASERQTPKSPLAAMLTPDTPPAVPPEPFNPPRVVEPPTPPPTPAGFDQPGLGPMFQTAEGSTISQGLPAAMTDAEFIAATRRPVPGVARSAVEPVAPTLEEAAALQQAAERTAARSAAETPSELATFFKSPVDVMGQAYRGAKATPGINPLATRQLGIGLQQEASAAGLPTRGPANLQKFLQERVSPEIGPISTPSTVRTVPSTGTVTSDLQTWLKRNPDTPYSKMPKPLQAEFDKQTVAASQKMAKSEVKPKGKLYGKEAITPAEKLEGAATSRPMTEEEVAEQISFIDRLKGLAKDESGGIAPEFAARLGLGAAGAAIGGATDPLDNPLLSAAAGGALGLAAPSAIPLLKRAMADPTLGPDEKTVTGMLSDSDGIQATAKSIWETMPQYFRANYLLSPNLLNNVVTGPYGAGATAAAEYHLAGDPRGAALLSALRPDKWAQEFATTWSEAEKLVGATERAGGELIGQAPTLTRRVLAVPGTAMTMGDVTTRRIAESVGFSADEARRMTMTNEPEFNFMRRLADLPRGSTVGQIALPFSRTLANIVEQGSMRIPGIGEIVQRNRAVPDELRTRLVQQGVGGAAGLAGMAAGYYAPEDPMAQRLTRGFTSNIAGRAALPAAMGYAAGRALGAGGTNRDVARAAVTEGFGSLPLPTVETPIEWGKYLLAEPGEGVLPRSAIPGVLRDASDIRFGRRGGTPAATQPGAPPSRFNWSP